MSSYSGRHRTPTRTERRATTGRRRLPKAFSAGYALPTAAAATLVVTAGGATAAQSTALASGSAVSAFTAPASQHETALSDPALAERSKGEVAQTVAGYSDLAQRRQESSQSVAEGQGRAQERQRVARDKKRKEVAERKREAAEAAKKRAAQKRAAQEKSAAKDLGVSTEDVEVGSDGTAQVADGAWVLPLANPVFTSGYGQRWGRLHAGDDFGVPVGTPLRAMSNGEVVFAGQQSGYGTMIDIRYSDGTISRYGHMSSLQVTVGQKVSAGQQVGLSGNTGRSTGPHLHLEIHPGGGEPVAPRSWLAGKGLTY